MKNQLMNYFESNGGGLTLEDILLNFLIASVLALVIFLSYRLSHAGVSYSGRFNVTLVMLTLVTTLVMNVIGNNIALSLGMVGALSIVRFRTAIKDTRDTAYIFWCIAIGICCGVSEYIIAGIGTTVIFILMMLLGAVKSNERYLLIIRGYRKETAQIEKLVDDKFQGSARLRVNNTAQDNVEYIYEISEKMIRKLKKDGPIVDYFYKNAELACVNLVCQNDEINR
jgi:uncharacterized membrane protein YhiD involved in acid resistance